MTAIFQCDYCGEEFENEMDCQECEKRHEALLRETAGVKFFDWCGELLPVNEEGLKEAVFLLFQTPHAVHVFERLCDEIWSDKPDFSPQFAPIPGEVYKYDGYDTFVEYSTPIQNEFKFLQKLLGTSTSEALEND